MVKQYVDKMVNFTYKTTNTINGEYYLGAHGSNEPFADRRKFCLDNGVTFD